jgi:DNA mismatch repair protein MutL
MGRIKLLPQIIVDKIAAGEMVERPASVVKELIENSIDASATEIKIEIEEGGKKLIRVSDNGTGISRDDMELLFVSHSTSKISDEKDLFAIKTLGFRGEALGSIASISQVRIISKTASEESGWEIKSQGGKRELPAPIAASKGSSTEVSNIFYSIPARLKFLKSTSVEFGHISDVFIRYAIAFPNIRFDLIHNNQPVLNLQPTDNLIERLSVFIGNDIIPSLIPLSIQENGWELKGFIASPVNTKSTMRMQWVYLNRRYIRDRIINRSIMQAYTDFIPQGRFPIIILFMGLPFSEFDVNVHPTKVEVRFRNSWDIHNFITASIRKHLNSSLPLPATAPEKAPGELPSNTNPSLQALVDFFTKQEQTKPEFTNQPYLSKANDLPGFPERENIIETLPQPNPQLTISHNYFQVYNSYIIEETPEAIVFIDQHAMHERLIYDRLKAIEETKSIISQQLLIPETLHLELRQASILNEGLPYLHELGFQIDDFGKNTVIIRAVPDFLASKNINELINEILNDMIDEDKPPLMVPPSRLTVGSGSRTGESDKEKTSLKEQILKMIACKSAIKAGTPLSAEEISALVKNYHARTERTQGTITCPHGRPAVHKIPRGQLEKYFLR